MTDRDYYQLLGIKREASDDDVKKAYRRLAMEHHPDRNLGKSDCEEHLKIINEAYQVLGNKEKRRQYDALSSQPLKSYLYYNSNFSKDVMEIFSTIFSGRSAGKGFGGCGGRGFGKRACGRWKGNF